MRSVFIILFFSVFYSFGQQVYIIDRSDSTAILFDEENPMSLLSLIQSNSSYFRACYQSGMSNADYNALSEKDRAHVDVVVGKPGTTPIKDKDPESPRFGQPLLVKDPLTGMQSYVYDPPDTFKIDLSNITRFIVEFGRSVKGERLKVRKLTLCKQFSGDDYVPVLILEHQDLLKMDEFNYLRMVDLDKLNDSEGANYWDVLKENRKTAYFSFFPRPYSMQFSREPVLLGEDYNQESFGTGLYFSTESHDMIDSLNPYVDSVYYIWKYPSTPLINGDPNSSDFGEPLVVIDSISGEKSFVYDDPWIFIDWMDCKPTLFVAEKYIDVKEKKYQRMAMMAYATLKVEGTYEIIAQHNLQRNRSMRLPQGEDQKEILWNDQFFSNLPPLNISDWRTNLLQVIVDFGEKM